jgi:hypothetical protein
MIVESASTDPVIHTAAMKMARKFVWIIQALLMDHEKIEALKQAYLVAREGLEEFKAGDHTK